MATSTGGLRANSWDPLGFCGWSPQKTAISWSEQRRASSGFSYGDKNDRQGRWVVPEHGDRDRRDGPIADLATSSGFHIRKRCFFQGTGSQRGIGDANFISLDPSSFGLQQAGGRKRS